jgi:hypothetical protein
MKHDLQLNFGTRVLTVEQLTEVATVNNSIIDTAKYPNSVVFKGLDDWAAIETTINNLKSQATVRDTDYFTSGFEWCFQYNVAE